VLIAVVRLHEKISRRPKIVRGRGAFAKFSSWSPPKTRVANQKVMQVNYAQAILEKREGSVKIQID
jgi:hypothetical protein